MKYDETNREINTQLIDKMRAKRLCPGIDGWCWCVRAYNSFLVLSNADAYNNLRTNRKVFISRELVTFRHHLCWRSSAPTDGGTICRALRWWNLICLLAIAGKTKTFTNQARRISIELNQIHVFDGLWIRPPRVQLSNTRCQMILDFFLE